METTLNSSPASWVGGATHVVTSTSPSSYREASGFALNRESAPLTDILSPVAPSEASCFGRRGQPYSNQGATTPRMTEAILGMAAHPKCSRSNCNHITTMASGSEGLRQREWQNDWQDPCSYACNEGYCRRILVNLLITN